MKINFKAIKITFVGSIVVLSSISFASISFADGTAQAGDQGNTGNRLSPIGYVWNWAAAKTNTDGSSTTTSNGNGGVLQDADNWELDLGGEYVPGKGWVPSDTFTVIEGGYNTIKDSVSTAAKTVITAVATPEIGKAGAQVLGATVAAGAVNFGEALADSDNGKNVSVVGAVARGTASAAVTEIVGQVIPGNKEVLADVVAKSIMKTSVKTAADTILNGATGKDPGKSVADDLTGGVIDVVLITVGVEGVEKDFGKAIIGGFIKDVSAGGPKVGGSLGMGGLETGGVPGHGGGSIPGGGYTPSQVPGGSSSGGYTPGQNETGDNYSHEDHHDEGKNDNNDDDDDAAYKAAMEECGCEGTITVNENGDVTNLEIHASGNPNPDGSGTDNGLGGKLEQMGVHLGGGWGRNDGDSTYGSSSSTSTNSANHVGGGTDLYEPDYDSQIEAGTASAPSSSNEGMGDGNASETGGGPGNGGGIRTHDAIGSGYSGNTADETGFGGLDNLPMVHGGN